MPSVFERLYKMETASSRQKKHPNHHDNVAVAPRSSNPRTTRTIIAPKRSSSTTMSKTSSFKCRTKSRGMKPTKVTKPVSKSVSKPITASKPPVRLTKSKVLLSQPVATSTKVLWSTKATPETFAPLSPSLTDDELAESLADYELGILSARHVAICIMDVMFHQEFTGSAPEWDINASAVAVVNSHDDDKIFDVSKEATYNHKDIYSVASSKARIRFQNGEVGVIRIEGYSYCVAG